MNLDHNKHHELGALAMGGSGKVKCKLLRRATRSGQPSLQRTPLCKTVIYNQVGSGRPVPIHHHCRQRQCHQSTKCTSSPCLFSKSRKIWEKGQTNNRSKVALPLTFKRSILCCFFALLLSLPSSLLQGNIWFCVTNFSSRSIVSIENREQPIHQFCRLSKNSSS